MFRGSIRRSPTSRPSTRAEPHAIFNFVTTCNDFERRFAEFLGRAGDVLHFAAPGTTEQGNSDTSSRIDDLKAGGAIGFHYPGWVAVQKDAEGEEVSWIIETSDRVSEDHDEKDAVMQEWCRGVTEVTGVTWKYIRMNQADFRSNITTLRQLVFDVIGNAMLRERDQRKATMSREEVRQARDEGREGGGR